MLFLSSPHLQFIVDLIGNLFLSSIDSPIGQGTFMRTKVFEPLLKGGRGFGQNYMPEPSSNFLLTALRRHFCCSLSTLYIVRS